MTADILTEALPRFKVFEHGFSLGLRCPCEGVMKIWESDAQVQRLAQFETDSGGGKGRQESQETYHLSIALGALYFDRDIYFCSRLLSSVRG